MANIRKIKRRIKSAKNIAQITRAMQMVAASKMKKAQAVAVADKPYAEKIYETVARFSSAIEEEIHPLFRRFPEAKKTLAILVSTNKGLCGGLNSNLFREVLQWFSGQSVVYISLGKKGRSFIPRAGGELLADFSERKFLESVPAVIQLVINEFKKGVFREVFILYNTFISALRYEPVRLRILPLELAMLGQEAGEKLAGEVIVEPSKRRVLAALIPHYLETQVRRSILEAEASEYSARMVAMKNATDNAAQLMMALSLEYNKIRQQQITYEIADIVTAKMGVEA